jgi:heat shock protein HtpX
MYSQIDSNKRNSVILMMFFIALIILLGYVYSKAWGQGSYAGIFVAILFSFGMTSVSYFQGDKIALWTSGAIPVTHADNEYIYHIVENLCLTAGLPTPKVYLINDPSINAFATGRKPDMASIAITTGALEKLDKEEMEGVIAHELSHVQNLDIRFMMLVAVMVGAVAILSDIFLRSRWLPRRNNDREGGNIGAILMIVGIILAILSPLIANLIKLAISRKREYLADASGSLLTRYPEGLARALEKIAAENQPMSHASKATAHLFIANPFSGKSAANLFSTHPPIEDRIKKLREMA